MSLYELHGVVIDSPVALPALPAAPDSNAELRVVLEPPAAVDVRLHDELVAQLGEDDSGYRIRRGQQGLYCGYGAYGSVVFGADSRVAVRLTLDDAEGAAALLSGSALAAWLVASNELVLHASSVAWGEHAIAIVGASHSGKTTLAAQCVLAGARLVSDDVLRISVRDGRASWFSGVRWLRLRPSAADLLRFWSGGSYRSLRDGRYVMTVADEGPRGGPLAALAFPQLGHGQRLEVTRLSAAEALRLLLLAPRVRGLCAADLLRRQFERVAHLARSVPSFRLVLPAGPPFEAEVGRALERELRQALERDIDA